MNIKLTKLFTYNKTKHLNDDPYRSFIFDWTVEWVDLMENNTTYLNR